MLLSLIIPIYNVAPYVADCLRSVMAQTYAGPLECILVDDCGTDDSMTVVEKTISAYHGPISFRIISHDHNRGLSAARNTGLAAATGDYVYFLDSDDEITPDCLSLLSAPLQAEPYDLAIGDCQIIGGTIPGVDLRLDDGLVLRGSEVRHAYRHEDWYMMSVNKLYRLSFLKEHRLQFTEGIIHEDDLWSFQIACMARSLAVVRHHTYIYKLREGSITVNRFSERNAASLNVILSTMTAFVASHDLSDDPDAHHLIRNFQLASLSKVFRFAPAQLPAFYRTQRQTMSGSWLTCCRLNGTDLRKQLRDFHLALPLSLALPYLKLLMHYYLRQSH